MADTTSPKTNPASSPKSGTSSPKAASPPGAPLKHGRTYHAYKAGQYLLPNDDVSTVRGEVERNTDHLLAKEKPIKRVFEAGCGTGIWAIDFADGYPEASVVGIDLSPVQPEFVPPNLEFFVDDLESDWTFVQPFDFIYCRLLTGSILDWPKRFGQTFTHLHPGGYIELFDTLNPLVSDDGTLTEDSGLSKWNRLLVEASEKLGRPLNSYTSYTKQLADAGFVNIVDTRFKWPMNTWPKDAQDKNGVQAVSLMLFTNVLGWTADQAEVLLVDVRKDAKNRAIHRYWPIHAVYAQKPE
ncbi:S-adenosyl-L-methionine-dependent methyltransferase [Immersiella caudata]|uniref:S-adenosyl-L-methionine-dependent methyltransferase n=1 Tax=Immersiella caudata TaxID=314043 RepID=A0AA39U2N4_9PEZI|nr:S-adenosyl-L-methionine-dependent methyltransferase [Immersiella caudata]